MLIHKNLKDNFKVCWF